VPRPVSFHERLPRPVSVIKEATPGRVVRVTFVPVLNLNLVEPFQINHVLFKLVEHETRDRRRGDATDVSLDLAPTLLDAWVLMGAEDRRDAERRGRPDAPHGGRVGRCVDVHRGFDGVTL